MIGTSERHMICGIPMITFKSVWNITTKTVPGPEVIKLFPCSTQLSTKFQLLIKTKITANKEVSCFKSLRWCIYIAYKC